MNRLLLGSISLFCLFINAFGQMPHEVLVIANQSSEDSLEVANYFIDKRQIPKNNLIKVWPYRSHLARKQFYPNNSWNKFHS